MKRETASERAAWTEWIAGSEGLEAKPSKYGNKREGKYASKREAMVAARLDALYRHGIIKDLREQERFVLVEGQGRIRPIVYVSDFTYVDDDGIKHVLDAKGYTKNPVYRLKKKLLFLLHGIEIEEV